MSSSSSPSIFLFFIIIFLALYYNVAVASAKCHRDDEAGLLAFKSGITQDPSGMLSSWKPGTDCCSSWAGVDCRIGEGGRVTTVSLYGQLDNPKSFLTGTISPSLAKLRSLDGIYFQDLRNISGPFPYFIFHLPKLQFVYIENAKLSGRLPDRIGSLTHLEALSLADHRFSGTIPASISQLTQLIQLKLSGNQLDGRVPGCIRRLRNLTLLSLDRNRLSGAIPDFFASFPQLGILRLSHNRFSGKIPATMAALAPGLQYLELAHNALTGKIPDFLGNFRALDTLDLSRNRFTGTVPKSFGNLTKIFNLNLSGNLLVDPFPVMKVKGIESLDLSNNRFHLGEIPEWVTSSPIIYSLKLAKCGIKMKLDHWNPAETYFYDYIDLSGNKITGSPVALLNRTEYLVGFWAGGNRLRFNMENLKIGGKLKHLDLSRNSVFGKLPAAGISRLEKLNVSHNHLCGRIPPTTNPASSFVGNDCLCGSPLPPCKS